MLAVETTPSFHFELPPELEATLPPELRGIERDEVRMMVSHRRDDRIEHALFRELPEHLRAGDLLVVNASATIPAALEARRESGEVFALHLSTQVEDGRFLVEPRKIQVRAGETFRLPGPALARLVAPYRESKRLWIADLSLGESDWLSYLSRHGRAIRYPYVDTDFSLRFYQTIFASVPGSAEMPSAARPFTARVVDELQSNGVRIATIVLHSGVASLESGEWPAEESCVVSSEAAEAVNETRAAGGRVVAVGTTVVRALESASDPRGRVAATRGWTDRVISPASGVKVIDGLLTGFHEPRATHLAMLEAVGGARHIQHCYDAALKEGYLWHEFGDVHLIV